MAKSTAEALATLISNLPEKTGKPLEEWLEIVKATGKEKHGDIVAYLKTVHSISHGYANQIALRMIQERTQAPTEGGALIEAQYTGPKATLKPIYDALVAVVRSFGDDIEIAPKKAYVSLRRNKQFAIIQPSTSSRLDLGINLKGMRAKGRLEESGSFNAMVTHRVRLSIPADIDAELKGWLRAAYDAS